MRTITAIIGLAVAVFAVLGIRACGPGGDGVIGRLVLPDKSEYLVTQKWNDIGEPYTVSFYFRTNGGTWGWCYIDHEDTRWRNVRLKYDAAKDAVQIYKGRELRAELFRGRQTFALHGSFNRELSAPQEHHDPPFAEVK